MQQANVDGSFVNALMEKDLAAFDSFYNRYAPAFYADVKRMIPLQKAADETLAVAFVSIWRSIEKYDPAKERLFTWSLKVVRKEASEKKINLVLQELFACRCQVSVHTI